MKLQLMACVILLLENWIYVWELYFKIIFIKTKDNFDIFKNCKQNTSGF